MIFNIKGREYMIQWKHWLPIPKKETQWSHDNAHRFDTTRPNGGTDASLFLIKDGQKELVYKVSMSVFHNDQFNYEKGRTETLTKLLNFRRTEIHELKSFLVPLPNGRKVNTPLIPVSSGKYNDDGMFNREDRTLIWDQYYAQKEPSETDLKGRFDHITKVIKPYLEELAALALQLGLADDILFIPDEDNDDEPA